MKSLVGVLLLSSLASCGQLTSHSSSEDQKVQIGRYVIVHSPHIQSDTVLLDTATGKTWEEVTFSYLEGDPDGWRPMARKGDEQEMFALEFEHPPKKKGGK
jgi:hypothetical protein